MKAVRTDEIRALPAFGISEILNRRLEEGNCAIVTAPPGAGKSTVLPLTILKWLEQRPTPGRILMLEPRRIAARQIAERMAWLLGEDVGETVGYRIRFESRVSARTRIEVLTEGILTRMLIDDPALDGVSAVIFDEFHERSLASDEALALTRQAQSLLREDLRIVIMSATIDTQALSEALLAPVVESAGRLFPVDVRHAADEADAGSAAQLVAKYVREAHAGLDGDILAFLPGEAEIRRCAELLGTSLGGTRICPLYGMLTNRQQKEAIAPSAPGARKVVLATPIAETSLTIEGVRVVVDSGLCKKMVFDSRTGLSRLETVRISLDMADQRSGRAGRVAPGVCYRLWSNATQARMAAVRTPEIIDADLASLVLDAAAWGENDVSGLPWLTPPPAARVRQAQALLQSLAAISDDGRITAHGRALAALPCHPRIARMLLLADTPARKALAADLAALLEDKDPMGERADTGVDLRIKALRDTRSRRAAGAWSRIIRIAEQYRSIAGATVASVPARAAGAAETRETAESTAPDPYEAGALLAAAYPERIGKAWNEGAGRFLLSGGELAAMEPADPLSTAEWIVAPSVNARPGGVGRIFLAAPVAVEDLQALALTRDSVLWDSRQGAAVARRERRIGVLTLSSTPLPDVPAENLMKVICDAAPKDGLSMFDFNDDVTGLQRRIATLAAWHPELGLPDVGAEILLSTASEWLPAFAAGATTAVRLKKVDLCQVILSRLSFNQQQALERLAPSHVTVPTGSRIRLEYRQGADAPVLRVRLQECFGLVDTPRVNGGATPVLMELLSPGFKPVQLTSDLRSFWSGTYFEVRKELRRRYPRHSWPENPLEAVPTRGVPKKNQP